MNYFRHGEHRIDVEPRVLAMRDHDRIERMHLAHVPEQDATVWEHTLYTVEQQHVAGTRTSRNMKHRKREQLT